MKKFYSFFMAMLTVSILTAQCTVSIEIVTNVNEVTATITGEGAVSPMYTIDWGDGSTFELSQTATHTYANPGQYTITYAYFDQLPPYCNQSATQDVIITGGGCTLDATPFAVGLAVTLQATSQNTSAPAYTIDWGDGSAIETADQGFHVYAAAGDYLICVTMVDQDNPDNCNLQQCETVTLVEQTGNCTVDLSVVVDGSSVSATAVGTGATIENYIIAWGDNTISNSANANHVYAISGTYNVCVYYGDLSPGGCQVSDCQEITAEAGTGSCTLEITPTIVGLNVVLTANGVGAEMPEYGIDWGDSSPIETTVPAIHNYAAPGTYLICVSYIDLNNLENCQVNVCQEITIEDIVTDCTLDVTITVDGDEVSVTSSGTGAENPTYVIQWGDGTIIPTFGSDGTHIYAEPGAFEVCVTYSDLNNIQGCTVTDCETVNITVGIEQSILTDESLSMIPNPLAETSVLVFAMNKAATVEAIVFDLVGNQVLTIGKGSYGQGTHRFNWNTSSLSSGIYFVKVKADGEERTMKVIR